MTNLSTKTRKELVLDLLRSGWWVNTAAINSPEVGGTEGTRRLRDLRKDGYTIEKRKNPDPASDQWQYRLVETETTATVTFETQPKRTPWVFWKTGRNGSFSGEYRNCDVWISPAVTGWVWRASSKSGLIDAGSVDTKDEAKVRTVAAVEHYLEGI